MGRSIGKMRIKEIDLSEKASHFEVLELVSGTYEIKK